jgi:hypothetical protein
VDYRVVINLFLLLFLGVADNQVIAALLPTLVSSLDISVGAAGLMVAAYSLAAASRTITVVGDSCWPESWCLVWRRGSRRAVRVFPS